MQKSFDKYFVKRDPASGRVVDSKTPTLGELAKKDCRLDQRRANILNRGWRNSGIYYQEVIEKKDAAPKKADLVSKCKELGIDESGTVVELVERIKNHEKED